MAVALPDDVIASLDGDEGQIRIGNDIYRWLRPEQSASLREAVTAVSKPPEGKTAADMLRAFLLLLRDLSLGNATGPVRKLASDVKTEGNLVRLLVVRTAAPDTKQIAEEITLQFVPEEALLARLARGESFQPTGKSVLRLLERYGEKCFPWLNDWAHQHEARALWEGRTSRIEDKIDALRFTDIPETARLMAERADFSIGKEWLKAHPTAAARGLTRTFLNLARGMSVLLEAGHRDLILREAGSMSPLSDKERQMLEHLLGAAATPYAPTPKDPPRVEAGLFGTDMSALATRFEASARRTVTKDADLSDEERKLVKIGLKSICALHDLKWKNVESFLKALQEDNIEIQSLTDASTKAGYTLVVHYVGDNAGGFLLRNEDGVALAEVHDGALLYDPNPEWP